jgi:hypothetical protein
MLHKTSLERYQKLKKVFDRLKATFNRDDLDDFVQTANSLREWIRQDMTLAAEQKDHLERLVVPESVDWQICNQLANQQKHVRRANPRRKRSSGHPSLVVKAVRISQQGAGFLAPGSMRIIGAGEEITIEWDDRRESALAFAIRLFRHFHFIFEVAPIPLQRRAPTNLFGDALS